MYYFLAHYTNYNTLEESTKSIKVEDQFYPNEKEVFVYAMQKAYDLGNEAGSELVFNSLELICC